MLNKVKKDKDKDNIEDSRTNKEKEDNANVLFARTTYLILLTTLFTLLLIHVFNVYTLNTDRFSFFLVTLIFILLMVPATSYIKAFGLVEVRKDLRVMEESKDKNELNR